MPVEQVRLRWPATQPGAASIARWVVRLDVLDVLVVEPASGRDRWSIEGPDGAEVLGLPDFAAYTSGHHEGQRYFDMFDSIMRYMLNTGNRLAAGHTMQIGAEEYLRCRAPA